MGKRSAGVLAMARATTWSIAGGRSGRRVVTQGGVASRWASRTASARPTGERRLAGQALVQDELAGRSRRCGRRPGPPAACSGAVYPGVLGIVPAVAERAVAAGGPGEPEVDQVDSSASPSRWPGDQDIARLDVAVDQPEVVGGGEGPGHLVRMARARPGSSRPSASRHRAGRRRGRSAWPGTAGRGPRRPGRWGYDVGMVDGGGIRHLAQEPGPEVRVAGQGRRSSFRATGRPPRPVSSAW